MTLFISDKGSDKMQASDQSLLIRSAFAYTLFTIILVLFGAVYERFSHEVYSFFMIYAFAIPMVLGLLPSLLLLMLKRQIPDPTIRHLWNAGIITWSIGSIYKGIIEIYGTTNKLIVVYLIASLIAMLVLRKQNRASGDSEEEEICLELLSTPQETE